MQTAITYVKNSMISGEELQEVEVEGVEFPPIYQEYCRLLRTHQLMDYDDQMIYAHRILRQFPQLLEQFRRRYPYLCVDEAQDTSKSSTPSSACWPPGAATCSWWGTRIRASTASGPPGPRR